MPGHVNNSIFSFLLSLSLSPAIEVKYCTYLKSTIFYFLPIVILLNFVKGTRHTEIFLFEMK